MPTRPTVLLIEDETVLRDILQEALETFGYAVVTAATVPEAEALRHRLGAEAIGLVLADIHLSHHGQEGYALFQRWTALHPTLPFVLMSGAANSRDLPAVQTGAVRFLAKPFNLDELLEIIQALLGEEASTPPSHSSR